MNVEPVLEENMPSSNEKKSESQITTKDGKWVFHGPAFTKVRDKSSPTSDSDNEADLLQSKMPLGSSMQPESSEEPPHIAYGVIPTVIAWREKNRKLEYLVTYVSRGLDHCFTCALVGGEYLSPDLLLNFKCSEKTNLKSLSRSSVKKLGIMAIKMIAWNSHGEEPFTIGPELESVVSPASSVTSTKDPRITRMIEDVFWLVVWDDGRESWESISSTARYMKLESLLGVLPMAISKAQEKWERIQLAAGRAYTRENPEFEDLRYKLDCMPTENMEL